MVLSHRRRLGIDLFCRAYQTLCEKPVRACQAVLRALAERTLEHFPSSPSTSHSVFTKVSEQIIAHIPSGTSRLETDPDQLAPYGMDRSRLGPYLPQGAIMVRDEEDLLEILPYCSHHRIPVTVQGGRTTPTGAALPIHGGVVLTFPPAEGPIELNERDQVVTVAPGMTLASLHQSLAAEGWFFPVDSGSRETAQLGGALGNNTAGKWAFKYGQFHHHLLGATLFLATGEKIGVGARVRKNATAFNLTPLLAGSQGMLGIATKLHLAIQPAAPSTQTLICFYSQLHGLDRALAKMLRAPRRPRALEMMDCASWNITRFFGEAVAILDAWRIPQTAQFALLIEEEGEEEEVERAWEEVWLPILEQSGAEQMLLGSDAAKIREIWKIRDLIPTAYDHEGRFVTTDFVVPGSKLREMLSFIQARRDHYTLPTGVFGHAGDGNLHVNIIAKTEEAKAKALMMSAELHYLAIQFGGVIAGEHNAGLTKAKYVSWQLGESQVALQQRIKQAFDPAGILNPGKLFHDRSPLPADLDRVIYPYVAGCSGE